MSAPLGSDKGGYATTEGNPLVVAPSGVSFSGVTQTDILALSMGVPTLNVAVTQPWQLAAGNYVPAKMPPVIIHPRPQAETNPDAYCKNAYPGLHWEIPISVQGGAWPFKYEIVTGPVGMTIGQTLTVSGDVQVVGSDYGVLSWPNPTGTSENIEIKVTDQDGTVVTVTWTLTIGTANHIFVDASAASEGTGTLADPLKTFHAGVYESSDTANSFLGKVVHYKAGTYQIHNGTSGINANLSNAYKPRSHVAWHNGTSFDSVTFDMTTGFFWAYSDDLFIGNIICDGIKPAAADPRMFSLGALTQQRVTFYKNTIKNLTTNNFGGTDNTCFCFGSSGASGKRRYVSMIRNTHDTTSTASLAIFYDVQSINIEHNVADGCTWVFPAGAGSNGAGWLDMKSDIISATIRRNSVQGALSADQMVLCLGNNIETNGVEFCWNVFEGSSSGVNSFVTWNQSTLGITANQY